PYLSCGKPPAGGWSACWKGPRPKEGCRKRAFRKKSCASHCAWWKVAAAWQRGQRKAMRLLQLWYRLSTIYVTTPQAAHGCRSWSGKVFSGVLWLPRPSENFRRVPSFGIATGSIAPACISSRTMAHNEVLLPIRIQKVSDRVTVLNAMLSGLLSLSELLRRNYSTGMTCLTEMVQEEHELGLDLRDEEAEPCLQLPHDFDPQGRLLPTARFITTPVKVMEGDSMEEACQELFAKLFARCDLSLLPGNLVAVSNVWWCERILIRYNKMSKRIAKAFSSPSVADPRIGQVLMAHFKAKGPGGENAKSRTTKQARVLDVRHTGMVTLDFLKFS
ncbi:unnamed protein product, partial [Polarella glacialis]